ncbi:MAG: hypothetical protein HKN25_03175 [Pyrinomonadaceae bacterium]|nr:hypothetical protein [Pyrinomonadaceae bacterium]
MSKKQCSAFKKNGEKCNAFANKNGFCYMHDATKGKERAIARRSGGLATRKPHFANESTLPSEIRSIGGVLIVLDYTLKEIVGLDNSIQRGRLLVSIAHGYIEALKVGEMEQRLEAVEMALSLRKENHK